MAYGKSLDMREIQPRSRVRGYEPNLWRRATKAEAKRLQVTRRRVLRCRRDSHA